MLVGVIAINQLDEHQDNGADNAKNRDFYPEERIQEIKQIVHVNAYYH
jgi:hypothetical protein